MALSKAELRTQMLSQLKQLSESEIREKSIQITYHLTNLLKSEQGCWGAYQALKNEPQINWTQDVSGLIDWCFPTATNQQLVFKSATKSFRRSSLGVSEPIDGHGVSLDQIQGCLIPGLAFSRTGFRLGRGKAFYDRSLKFFKGRKIGVCFEKSFLKEIPTDEHDILIHQVVTECGVYQVGLTEGEGQWS